MNFRISISTLLFETKRKEQKEREETFEITELTSKKMRLRETNSSSVKFRHF